MATDKRSTNEDTTGRDRIVKNVFSSWVSHFVLIIIGFVMPRMIDSHLGQTSLGIWDMSWSFVNYLSLSGLGVGSSVNRYVAKYYSKGDFLSLNNAVSSVVAIQCGIALMVVIGTGVLVAYLPSYLNDWSAKELGQAKTVVGLLGISLGVQMLFDSFRGVITGVHRWDIHNGLNAGSSMVTAFFMIVVLLLGYGLEGLAVVYLVVNILAELVRLFLAYRVCPQLSIKIKYIGMHHVRKMMRFGLKTIIVGAPWLIVIQTVNIILAGTLGAAALAIFMRPVALVRHIETFLNKFAHVLTPTVGSLMGAGKHEEIKGFLLTTTEYAVAITLPLVLFLAVLGDHVLVVWMGHDYATVPVITILAIGSFLSIAQSSVLRVLMGMNLHGRIAIITFLLSIFMLAVGVAINHQVGWTLTNAAVMIAVIMTVTKGLVLPIYACRKIGLSYIDYFIKSFRYPVLSGIPLFAWLYGCRFFAAESSIIVLIFGMIGSAVLLSVLYWPYYKRVFNK